MLFDADGKGLKTAPAETKATHVRRHVALFWSCDPPESEAGSSCSCGLRPAGDSKNALDWNYVNRFNLLGVGNRL